MANIRVVNLEGIDNVVVRDNFEKLQNFINDLSEKQFGNLIKEFSLKEPHSFGLKQYELTITGTQSWETARATGIPYIVKNESNEDVWRLRLNISGSTSNVASATITLVGIVFKEFDNHNQALVVHVGSDVAARALANPGEATISLNSAAATTVWKISGDVELEQKPTFFEES